MEYQPEEDGAVPTREQMMLAGRRLNDLLLLTKEIFGVELHDRTTLDRESLGVKVSMKDNQSFALTFSEQLDNFNMTADELADLYILCDQRRGLIAEQLPEWASMYTTARREVSEMESSRVLSLLDTVRTKLNGLLHYLGFADHTSMQQRNAWLDRRISQFDTLTRHGHCYALIQHLLDSAEFVETEI
ncbi:MAG: hypothetical protein Q7R81_06125 [Candidatus Peregrinibacteria bacterium]|nr:hypothetical protein [Candidatus Peregrinibacteria bacterium]